MLIFLFVTVTFLYTSFAANIVALLQSSSSQIRTLDDLLHSRIKFGVHDTVFNRYYFSVRIKKHNWRSISVLKILPRSFFCALESGLITDADEFTKIFFLGYVISYLISALCCALIDIIQSVFYLLWI